jgi:hypothetical protein
LPQENIASRRQRNVSYWNVSCWPCRANDLAAISATNPPVDRRRRRTTSPATTG